VFFEKKLPRGNNRPSVENSSNLVTLYLIHLVEQYTPNEIRSHDSRPKVGVNVMNTLFGDFYRFSAKKGDFLEN
jgi:hypothetical protein